MVVSRKLCGHMGKRFVGACVGIYHTSIHLYLQLEDVTNVHSTWFAYIRFIKTVNDRVYFKPSVTWLPFAQSS